MEGYLQDPASGFLTPIIFHEDMITYNGKKYKYTNVIDEKLLTNLQKFILNNKKVKHIISCFGNIYYIYL